MNEVRTGDLISVIIETKTSREFYHAGRVDVDIDTDEETGRTSVTYRFTPLGPPEFEVRGTEGDSVPAVTRDQLRQAWFNVNSFDTFVASVRDLGVPIDETPTERLAVLISEEDGGDRGAESYMDIAGKLVARGVTVEEGENDD
ncbi:UNVERIFIED_CONTAM: hypothetical protein IGO34_22735 [Salmonella enterica subsp. enterica serovar Weltevreden]